LEVFEMSETRKLVVGGRGIEFAHFANRVIQGMRVKAPTTGSTQATGASGTLDGNVDIEWGMLAVGSQVAEYAVQADFAVADGDGIIQVGEAIVIDIVAYVSKGDNEIYLKVFTGAAALTASAVGPTDAEIEAYFAADTSWMKIGQTKIERDADTTVVQTYDNTVRNTLVPGTVHYGTNPLA
jgi:hypothetical protein